MCLSALGSSPATIIASHHAARATLRPAPRCLHHAARTTLRLALAPSVTLFALCVHVPGGDALSSSARACEIYGTAGVSGVRNCSTRRGQTQRLT